jgi:hypothetical protein
LSLPEIRGISLADQGNHYKSPALSVPENITQNFLNPPNRNIESRALLQFCIVLTTFYATELLWGTRTNSGGFFVSDGAVFKKDLSVHILP